MNFGTIAVIGSILAGLVSLPAVSASITGDITSAGATLSGISEQEFEETPRTVVEQVSADSMEKIVETAFGRVTFRSTPENFTSELENPRYSLSVERESGVEELAFTTEGVEMDIRKTSEAVEERCNTPQGTLEEVVEGGEEKATFSGTGRQAVRESCADARNDMEEQVEKVRSLSVDLGFTLPEVNISQVNSSKESVTIVNEGGTDVKLDGWELSDEGGNTFSSFGEIVLAPGRTVTVYSEQSLDSDECDESEGPQHELCWDSSFVWNDDGETATLVNSRGETVDTHTYN